MYLQALLLSRACIYSDFIIHRRFDRDRFEKVVKVPSCVCIRLALIISTYGYNSWYIYLTLCRILETLTADRFYDLTISLSPTIIYYGSERMAMATMTVTATPDQASVRGAVQDQREELFRL